MPDTDDKVVAPAGGKPSGRKAQRSAALTATLIALPIAVIAWIGFYGFSGGFSGSSSSAGPSPTVAASSAVEVDLTAPTPAPTDATTELTVATYCRALLAKLSKNDLGGHAARPVTPAAAVERAAAWGDPPIVLRCGVGSPAVDSGVGQDVTIDQGVTWRVQDGSDGASIAKAVGRTVAVEVDIPGAYAGHPNTLLGPLNAPIMAAIPLVK
jgi:hypothetical protein